MKHKMKNAIHGVLSGFIIIFIIILFIFAVAQSLSATTQVAAPTLKWQKGGCYSSWCGTGWYSSPAAVDLDKDGTIEIIAASYSIFVLNSEDGSVQWTVDPEGGRVWPGVVVCDLDNDGDLEIVTGHGSGYLHVFSHTGALVWTRRPSTQELRGLSIADLDNDGTMEIIVNGAVGSKVNTWVYEHNGNLRSGWPQLNNDTGYAYGVFNDNAAVGDIDNDGTLEIIVPSDVHYICAYEPDGTQVNANAIYGDKAWGKVGVWESYATELRGWGYCSGDRAERYRTNFAHGAAVIADVDNNGTSEVIVTGNVYDCAIGHPPGKYNGVYIFNNDRSRYNSGGFNWEAAPVDTGAPLTESYEVIENNQPNPVVADLDGDGNKEILYSSYDGRVHAFWLDKTEHGNWPYSVYHSSEGHYRFASEPLVADLDNDGYAEVIFTSWVQKNTYKTGELHILNHLGVVLQEIALPAAFGSPDWNGALPAPTLANIDNDTDLELIVNSAHSGVITYDLPGTANAQILWGTGRGNYLRNGCVEGASLVVSPDFNRDGHADILWRNRISGENGVWFMENQTWLGFNYLNQVANTDWIIAGTADFNSDGYVDILWRHKVNGNNAVWYMNKTKYTGNAFLPRLADTNWQIAGAADFNGDSRADILWRNTVTGENGIWFMNGVRRIGQHFINTLSDTQWEIPAVVDFDGDGMVDIMWRHSVSGQNGVWFMNREIRKGFAFLNQLADTDWLMVGAADFNEDGATDILWRNKTNGKNAIWYMKNNRRIGNAYIQTLSDTNWEAVN